MHFRLPNATPNPLGKAGEQIVCDLLWAKGFHIVGTNLHFGPTELDIVAKQIDLLLVVEVKTRSPKSWQKPFSSFGLNKRKHLRFACENLWQRVCRQTPKEFSRIRVDAASVLIDESGTEVSWSRGIL